MSRDALQFAVIDRLGHEPGATETLPLDALHDRRMVVVVTVSAKAA